jgi:1-acyl-sn-glycerol-3-phosphate acyltransferase
MILGLPVLLGDRHAVFRLARFWCRNMMWLHEKICGVKVEFRGRENIPAGGIIIAPKHQSAWETMALVTQFPDFTYILKRELMWLPMFGWYLARAEQVAIDRSRGANALATATEIASRILREGRQLFIFPEGTRRPVGAPPRYKFGVARIYAAANASCLPVALNSGLFWPKRSFLRPPGTIIVEYLEPIAPGLDAQVFFDLLQERIETATNRLIAETLVESPWLTPKDSAPEPAEVRGNPLP